jgi:hypothetical protein
MKKFKFNWIDALVCLIIVAMAAGAVYKFTVSGQSGNASAAEPIDYTILLSGARQGSVDAIQIGDTLYDNDSGNAIGTIDSIDVEPASTVITDSSNGTIQVGTIENKYDLYIHISASGSIGTGGYYVNGNYQLNVGSSRTLYTKYAAFSAKIYSIDK